MSAFGSAPDGNLRPHCGHSPMWAKLPVCRDQPSSLQTEQVRTRVVRIQERAPPGARGRSAVDSATVVIIVAAAISAAAWQLFSLSDNPGRGGCANNMERNVPPSRRSAIAKRLELRRRETRAGKF